MDVLGVKASHLNLSGAPGGIVEKIRRQHSGVWFLILLKATAMLISPHHTGGKHIALAERQEAHAHESACVCAGSRGKQNARPTAHFNTIHRQFRLNSLTLRLRAADSYLIPNRREEETTSAEYLCIVAADTSQTGVFVEDWMDRSGQGKAGYWPAFDDVLRTLNP